MSKKAVWITIALLVYTVAGAVAAAYLAGAIYLVINKTWPHGVTASTWWDYWQVYSADAVQRKRLQLAVVIAAGAIYITPLVLYLENASKRRSLHGDARFATAAEVRATKLLGKQGIVVGQFNGQYLLFDGQQFVLVAAPTRSGKGVSIAIPNLLNFPGSVVGVDIKLENFRLTSKFRSAHGQQVFLFNPFAEDGQTHRWNALDGVRRDKNFRVGDILSIGQSLYPNDNPKDAFWQDQARNLFLGLALYLLETPALPCTLGEILRQSSGKGQPIKDYLQGVMAERLNGEAALSDECLDALNRFCSTSENTMASILATFNAPLTIFANPIVDTATSACDFDVAKVREVPMSIYVGIPPDKLKDAALLVNLFFSQLIKANLKELPQNNPKLKHQVLLILDEFTALGKIGIIAESNSFIAGYNIRLLTIIQSLAQLEGVYGKEVARTLVTNHALQVLFPPREQRDANEYSEMLGYFTEKAVSTGVSRSRGLLGGGNPSSSENVSDQRRALMLPQELKELDQSKEIVILENAKPIMCEKSRYYATPVFIDRLKAVSPFLRALGKRLPGQRELEEAAFVRKELSAPVPTLDVDGYKAKVENRTRVAKVGDEIDINKLATDLSGTAPLDDPDEPSDENVAELVDSFFAQLDWADANTGEIGEAPEGATAFAFGEAEPGGVIEDASESADDTVSVLDDLLPDDEVLSGDEAAPDDADVVDGPEVCGRAVVAATGASAGGSGINIHALYED